MKYWIPLFAAFTLQSLAYADELELALSQKSIDGTYETFYSNNFSTQISLLHASIDNVKNSDARDPATYNVEADNIESDMASFGVFANGKQRNIQTHLGGKVFYLDTDNSNKMHGVALGGGIDAYIRSNFYISGQLLYAPDIITGGDFDNYFEISTRANFQILRNASIFIGYKDIQADFKKRNGKGTRDREIFEGAFLGFRFNI